MSTVLDIMELFVSSGYSGKSLICRQIILEFREVLLDILKKKKNKVRFVYV